MERHGVFNRRDFLHGAAVGGATAFATGASGSAPTAAGDAAETNETHPEELCFKPLTEIAALIRHGDLSAVEVVRAHIERRKAVNSIVVPRTGPSPVSRKSATPF